MPKASFRVQATDWLVNFSPGRCLARKDLETPPSNGTFCFWSRCSTRVTDWPTSPQMEEGYSHDETETSKGFVSRRRPPPRDPDNLAVLYLRRPFHHLSVDAFGRKHSGSRLLWSYLRRGIFPPHPILFSVYVNYVPKEFVVQLLNCLRMLIVTYAGRWEN